MIWHGCSGNRMLLEPERNYDFERNHGLGMDAVVTNEPRDLLVQVASVAGDIHGTRSRVHRHSVAESMQDLRR